MPFLLPAMSFSTWFIILSILSSLPHTSAYTSYAQENSTLVVQSVSPCHLTGDADLYGLGVRLSFYIQWISALCLRLFQHRTEMKSLRRGFNILIFAVLINLWVSANRGSFALFEWYLMSLLIFLLPLMVLYVPPLGSLPSISSDEEQDSDTHVTETGEQVHRRSEPRDLEEQSGETLANQNAGHIDLSSRAYLEDPIGLSFLWFMQCMYAFSQPWLYFKITRNGYDRDCRARVYAYFAPVDLYNRHWLAFFKVSGIMVFLLYAVLLYPIIRNLLRGFFRQRKLQRIAEELDDKAISIDSQVRDLEPLILRLVAWQCRIDAIRQKSETPAEPLLKEWEYNQKYLAKLEDMKTTWGREEKARHTGAIVAIVVNIVIGGASIVFVERTLVVNNISLRDSLISSSGQLLALLIAIFSVAAVLWHIATKQVNDYRAQKWLDSTLNDMSLAVWNQWSRMAGWRNPIWTSTQSSQQESALPSWLYRASHSEPAGHD